MPRLYKYKGIEFFFWSDDHKPVHLHVKYGGAVAKAELHDGLLGTYIKWRRIQGELPRPIASIAERLILTLEQDIRRKWDAFHDQGRVPKTWQIRKLRT